MPFRTPARALLLFPLFCVLCVSTPSWALPDQEFIALCYHDLRSNDEPQDLNVISIRVELFERHMAWLKENGYTTVTIDDLILAHEGLARLPEKPVLLTFDDGYRSFYEFVFPILQKYDFKAVLSIVGEWFDVESDDSVVYGDRLYPRNFFLTKEQIRQMAASGLVEPASHSYALHRAVRGNPQGSLMPAAAVPSYDPETGIYETVDILKKRIAEDIGRSRIFLQNNFDFSPRVIAWPYGNYTRWGARAGAEAGMPVSLVLDEETPNTTRDISIVFRHLITADESPENFAARFQKRSSEENVRAIQVDMDYIYDPDPAVTERNLELLIDRLDRISPNVVYLQAWADPDGKGSAAALYFPNRHLPVRADLFSRVAWQLKTRLDVKVYAWMPVLAFEVGDDSWAVRQATSDDRGGAYRRLSASHPDARRVIRDLYEDLAEHAFFEGILFHDDGILGDREDNNPFALRWYSEKLGLPADIEAIRANPAYRGRWSRAKTRLLIDLTDELTRVVDEWRPGIRTARNIFAQPVLNPEAEEWYAQALPEFLSAYDHTALMAMPYMENVPDVFAFYRSLCERASNCPDGLRKVVFELQTKDWKTGKPLTNDTLLSHFFFLKSLGAQNAAWYPDDFIQGHPDPDAMRIVLNLFEFSNQKE